MNIKTETNTYRCMWCGKTFDDYPKDGKCVHCNLERILPTGKYVVNNPHFTQIIKISSAEVINSMRRGSFWFQSPRYFQEYSGDGQKARADIHDAKYSFISKDGNTDDENADSYRILCFYSLDIDKKGNYLKTLDPNLKKFGDYYSIIDLATLLLGIKEHLVASNKDISYVANWVSYLTDKYSGVYSPFCKFPEYKYQNEFRIVLLSSSFLSLNNKHPYKTVPAIENLDQVFSEPLPLDNLLHAKNIYDL